MALDIYLYFTTCDRQ